MTMRMCLWNNESVIRDTIYNELNIQFLITHTISIFPIVFQRCSITGHLLIQGFSIILTQCVHKI